MKNKYFISIRKCFIVVFIIFGASGDGYSEEPNYNLKDNTFVLAANRNERTPLYKWWAMIFTSVFDELGINLKINSYPMKRASTEADLGVVDGEPVRIYSYAKAHPNLVRVAEYVHMMPVSAYSTDPNFSVDGWESLKESELKIGHVRGFKDIEDNLSKLNLKGTPVTTAEQGLKVLLANRLELFIDDRNSIDLVLPYLSEEERKRIHFAGLLRSTKLYMYIHKDHKELAPIISEELKKLKQRGLIQKYRNIAFGLGIK